MKTQECTVVFPITNDRILLGMKKRGFGKDLWNGLGGKIEPGETVEQAMIRECEEEIGITPTAYNYVARHDFILDADTKTPWRMLVHTYLCTEWEGGPVETDEMRPKWFDQNNLPYDQMWADDIYWLPRVLSGELLTTTFEFDTENTLISNHVTKVEKL